MHPSVPAASALCSLPSLVFPGVLPISPTSSNCFEANPKLLVISSTSIFVCAFLTPGLLILNNHNIITMLKNILIPNVIKYLVILKFFQLLYNFF